MLTFLKNMRIWQKLGLVVLLFAVTTGLVLWFYIAEKNAALAATRAEVDGAAYLKVVKSFYQHVPQHRGTASAVLNGDASLKPRLAALDAQIDDDLKAVLGADALYGATFRTTDLARGIEQDWQSLKSATLGLTPQESFARHTQLVARTADLMLQVRDGSGLTQDPTLDGIYLVLAVTDNAPVTVESLGQLRARGAGLAASKRATNDDRAQIVSLVSQVRSGLGGLSRSMGVAFTVDSALRDQYKVQLEQANTEVGAFLDLVNQRILAPDEPTIDAPEYFNAATKTIDQYFALYDGLIDSLNTKLQARDARLTRDKYTALGVLVFGLLLALGLTAFIALSITGQVRSIMTLFSMIGMGEFSARSDVRSSDELGVMAESLNSLLDNILGLIQSQDEKERIQESIMKLLEEISGVAEGDLTSEAEVTAEVTGAIADSFNFMIAELRRIISNVQETTVKVTAAATEIQLTARNLAEGSESQAEQIVGTSAAVREMTASVQQVSESAAMSATVAEQARVNAQQGAEAVEKTIGGMSSIRQQVQETAKKIKRLGESSQEVGEIVQLIGDIADRTSILALNASIQAAMAGEAGRGFAVVAAEVERLAERSAEATKRIGTLIKSIQSETNDAVAAMEATTREVVVGSEIANEAGKALEEIEAVSNRLAELIRTISVASSQQARGSESVAQAMTDISTVTQQTAEGTKQAAVSIHQLAELADGLRSSVSAFKLPGMAPYSGNGGNGNGSAHHYGA